MSRRPVQTLRPSLEILEAKHLLSAGVVPMTLGGTSTVPAAVASDQTAPAVPNAPNTVSTAAVKPNFGYLLFRITNPTLANNHLTPPFGHVLVQNLQPVPGQIYNITQVTVKNGTNMTFDASSNFQVKFPGQRQPTQILTGNETWNAGQNFIFYVLTKKYYPFKNQATDGFEFNLGGARSVALPGPSGIFLRVKYNPATINKVLDTIVTRGAGAQGGLGLKYGIPDTAIDEFVSAKVKRNDFGGYF